MPRTRRIASVFVASCLFVAVASAEEGESITATSLDLDVADGYVWRGQVLSDDAVLQPGYTVAYGDLSFNIWSNMNLDRGGDRSVEFNEIDFTVGYAFSAGRASMDAGLISYSFPNSQASSTTELFFTTSLADLPVEPSFGIYVDVDEANGFYATASVAKSFSLSPRFGLDTALSAGWGSSDYNDFYFAVDDGALNDVVVSLAGSFAVNERLGLSLGLSYMWLDDSEIETGAETIYGESDRLSIVFGLSHAF